MSLDDGFADDFAIAVKLVINGKQSDAAQKLLLIATPQIQSSSSKRITESRQVQVFRRDRFICRYCNRRTVLCPLLRLIAARFPREFPYHSNWKMTECHIAFWRSASSCDHLIPVARGGSSDTDNLVTSCYKCNSMKQNWLKEELEWPLLPSSSVSWDGLSGLYLELLKNSSSDELKKHRPWQRALEQHSVS